MTSPRDIPEEAVEAAARAIASSLYEDEPSVTDFKVARIALVAALPFLTADGIAADALTMANEQRDAAVARAERAEAEAAKWKKRAGIWHREHEIARGRSERVEAEREVLRTTCEYLRDEVVRLNAKVERAEAERDRLAEALGKIRATPSGVHVWHEDGSSSYAVNGYKKVQEIARRALADVTTDARADAARKEDV